MSLSFQFDSFASHQPIKTSPSVGTCQSLPELARACQSLPELSIRDAGQEDCGYGNENGEKKELMWHTDPLLLDLFFKIPPRQGLAKPC